MKRRIILLLILFLCLFLIPNKTKGDAIAEAPIEQESKPVRLVEVPSKLPLDRVPYFLEVDAVFQDAPVMKKIAMCESGYNPTIKNPGSSASGIFQITKGTWEGHQCEGDVFDANDNIKCAEKIYEANGTTDWNASKSCWQ